MDIPYQKFFFALAVLGPMFGCALPNFAALAPTPMVQPTPVAVESARSEADDPQSNSAVVVEAPPALIPIEQLPPVPTVSTAISTDLINIEAGVDYQITGNATVLYTAKGDRPFVVRLSSSAGTAQIRTLDGAEVENIEVRSTVTEKYITVPTPFGAAYELNLTNLDNLADGSMTVRVFDLALGAGNISTTADFIGVDDLIRSELNMSPGSFYVVILQPSGELDAVMELYDTAGIVDAKDDGGEGEAETFFVSADIVSEWAIVIYSYLGSSGDFTLDIYEFP